MSPVPNSAAYSYQPSKTVDQKLRDIERRLSTVEERLSQSPASSFFSDDTSGSTDTTTYPEDSTTPFANVYATEQRLPYAKTDTNIRPHRPDPKHFDGTIQNFPKWQAAIEEKLSEMTNRNVEEHFKMQYVLSRTTGQPFSKLVEGLQDGSIVFGGAKQMVNYLVQYFDEDVRKVDLRFGRG